MKTKEIDSKIKNAAVSVNPYVYKVPSISEKAIRILIMLAVQVIFLIIYKSYSALHVILSTTLGAVFAYSIHFFFYRRQHFSGMLYIIQGIMIGMLLPESYPVVTAFFISFAVIFLAKYIFADCVTSWINIVAVGVVIAWFIGRRFFPDFLIKSDILALKNPSVLMIQNGIFPVYGFDTVITAFLNNTVFSWIHVSLPEGFISLLWDSHSVIPAFRFNFLTILASIVLFSDDSYSGIIPGFFLVTYLTLVRLFFPLLAGGDFNQGDILLAMCSSGTLFVTVFVISWYGTHPMTTGGKIIYGILAGIIAFIIVGCGTSPIGMIYTVLFCNIINLLIRVVEEKKNEVFVSKLA